MEDNNQLIELIRNSLRLPRKISDDEILVWLYFEQLEKFTQLIGYTFLSDGGFDVNIQSDSICINIKEVLDYLGIDEDLLDI